MDGLLKALSADYPAIQVSALRGLSSLPLALVWALWRIGPRGLVRVRWSLQLLRGLLLNLFLNARKIHRDIATVSKAEWFYYMDEVKFGPILVSDRASSFDNWG